MAKGSHQIRPELFRQLFMRSSKHLTHPRDTTIQYASIKDCERTNRSNELENVVANVRGRAPDVRHRGQQPHRRRHRRPRGQRLGTERLFPQGFSL